MGTCMCGEAIILYTRSTQSTNPDIISLSNTFGGKDYFNGHITLGLTHKLGSRQLSRKLNTAGMRLTTLHIECQSI